MQVDSQTRRLPLWVTAASIALIVLGFSRSRVEHASMPAGRQRPGSMTAQRGRGRSATPMGERGATMADTVGAKQD